MKILTSASKNEHLFFKTHPIQLLNVKLFSDDTPMIFINHEKNTPVNSSKEDLVKTNN